MLLAKNIYNHVLKWSMSIMAYAKHPIFNQFWDRLYRTLFSFEILNMLMIYIWKRLFVWSSDMPGFDFMDWHPWFLKRIVEWKPLANSTILPKLECSFTPFYKYICNTYLTQPIKLKFKTIFARNSFYRQPRFHDNLFRILKFYNHLKLFL